MVTCSPAEQTRTSCIVRLFQSKSKWSAHVPCTWAWGSDNTGRHPLQIRCCNDMSEFRRWFSRSSCRGTTAMVSLSPSDSELSALAHGRNPSHATAVKHFQQQGGSTVNYATWRSTLVPFVLITLDTPHASDLVWTQPVCKEADNKTGRREHVSAVQGWHSRKSRAQQQRHGNHNKEPHNVGSPTRQLQFERLKHWFNKTWLAQPIFRVVPEWNSWPSLRSRSHFGLLVRRRLAHQSNSFKSSVFVALWASDEGSLCFSNTMRY